MRYFVVIQKAFGHLLGAIMMMLNMNNAATLHLILLALNLMKQENLSAITPILAAYVQRSSNS
jgi:hypothetical protein